MSQNQTPSITYKDAGVDIEAGNALVERIKQVAISTRRPEVMAGLGGFGALCKIPAGYDEPVLVSGTDGVGTKLRLAIDLKKHDTVGIDLVAMCVNDLIVCGAEPLFFLDYYATGKLDIDIATAVVTGIGKGCELSGCSLVGGETAEMPGMYEGDDYDLAGFCVGVVENNDIIDGKEVTAGDVLIGLASSGPHSNGYSLIRKILEVNGVNAADVDLDGQNLAEVLLTPTRIYVQALLHLIKESKVHALAHITGGDLLENIPRVLPEHTKAIIDTTTWEYPAVFQWLQEKGNISATEMHRTFNCGIGMVICVPASETDTALGLLSAAGETAMVIGAIASAEDGDEAIELK